MGLKNMPKHCSLIEELKMSYISARCLAFTFTSLINMWIDDMYSNITLPKRKILHCYPYTKFCKNFVAMPGSASAWPPVQRLWQTSSRHTKLPHEKLLPNSCTKWSLMKEDLVDTVPAHARCCRMRSCFQTAANSSVFLKKICMVDTVPAHEAARTRSFSQTAAQNGVLWKSIVGHS